MIFKSGSPSLGKSCLIDRPPALRERLQWNDAEKRGSLAKWWASQLTRKISVLRAKTNLNSAPIAVVQFSYTSIRKLSAISKWSVLIGRQQKRALPLVFDWLILLKAEFSPQNSPIQSLEFRPPQKNLWNRSGRNSHWILEVFLVQD